MIGRELDRPHLPNLVTMLSPDAESDILDAERRFSQAVGERSRNGIQDTRPRAWRVLPVRGHRVLVGEPLEPASRRAEVGEEIVPTAVAHRPHLLAGGPSGVERVVPELPLGAED